MCPHCRAQGRRAACTIALASWLRGAEISKNPCHGLRTSVCHGANRVAGHHVNLLDATEHYQPRRTNVTPARRLGCQLLGGWQHELHQRPPRRAHRVHLGRAPARDAVDNLCDVHVCGYDWQKQTLNMKGHRTSSGGCSTCEGYDAPPAKDERPLPRSPINLVLTDTSKLQCHLPCCASLFLQALVQLTAPLRRLRWHVGAQASQDMQQGRTRASCWRSCCRSSSRTPCSSMRPKGSSCSMSRVFGMAQLGTAVTSGATQLFYEAEIQHDQTTWLPATVALAHQTADTKTAQYLEPAASAP